jgi:outer membrane protein OmpA-like peptidoglycan-associated protein
MKKLLILLIWLIGLAVIAWLCLRGQEAGAPALATAEPSATAPPTTLPALSTIATTAAPVSEASSAVAPASAAGPAADASAPAAPAPESAAAPAALPSQDLAAARAKIAEVLQDKVVEFGISRAVLSPAGQATVAQIATILKQHPTLKVEVRGHTDSTGPADVNYAFSRARADVVKSVLVSDGIDPNRITSTGYGATQPVADNGTPEGRARNRRIDFHVEENK